MFKIERTIKILAPVQRVFDYMTDPANFVEFWPSMVQVKDVKPTPTHIGETFHWVYKMAGLHLEGDSERTEYVPNKRTVSKNTGGIPSTFIWEFQEDDGHTLLRVDVEYTAPASLLGRLTEPFIRKLNEHEADVMLANLKARMELVPEPGKAPA
jgi:uncharacterized membrane protein